MERNKRIRQLLPNKVSVECGRNRRRRPARGIALGANATERGHDTLARFTGSVSRVQFGRDPPDNVRYARAEVTAKLVAGTEP